MKKRINIKVLDFPNVHPYSRWPYWELIEKHFDINLTDRPDYVLDLGDQYQHHWYDDCVKILFEQECNSCDFSKHDYIIGFDDLTFGDRYIRIPLFARWPSWTRYLNRLRMSDKEMLDRPFCSAVISNDYMGDPLRRDFIERLAQYKPIAMGGRYKNNVGGRVKDKIDFCRGYKFNLALENASYPGYTTEKIMEAYAADTLPVYYGNPQIETDCRLESMVRIKDRDDIERAVAEIIRLDTDDEAYLEKMRESPFAEQDLSSYSQRLEEFLFNVFDQPLAQARRRTNIGFAHGIQHHVSRLMRMDYYVVQTKMKFDAALRKVKRIMP